jgi:phosphatidylglycerophosphate synthase
MPLAGRPGSRLIARVVILADESAHYVVAGLTQLDRLFRTLEECFASPGAEGPAPEIVVWWKAPQLVEQRATRLATTHRVAGQPLGRVTLGGTLVLRTDLVFKRGALSELLRAPDARTPLSLFAPEALPEDWDALQATQPSTLAGDMVWRIDSVTDIPAVERKLLRSSGKPTDGLVARTLNRPLSRLLSRWLVQTRVTPNQVSFLVLGVLTASTWVLARGTPRGFVVGMLLFQLASVLDGCDGEIARAKFLETRLGAWLDTSVDLLGNFLLALAIGIGLAHQSGLPAELRGNYLLEGILTAAGIAIGIFVLARARPGRRDNFNDFGSSTVSGFKLPASLAAVLQVLVLVFRRDAYALLFVLLAVAGRPDWILHLLAIGVALQLPVILRAWWKSARVTQPVKAPDRP